MKNLGTAPSPEAPTAAITASTAPTSRGSVLPSGAAGADPPPPPALAPGEDCYIPSWAAGQGSLVTAVLSNAVSRTPGLTWSDLIGASNSCQKSILDPGFES